MKKLTELLTDRYKENIVGTLSCIDRILIKGTRPEACYAEGMAPVSARLQRVLARGKEEK